MSTQTEITRLETARNTLRTKAVELGIATSAAKLDALATAYNGIINRGTIQATVQEGDTYTIQPGYYAGGTVSGVAGGGNYTLQEKIVTPTKSQQSVSADSGFYGLSAVTVNAIPDIYQDVSSVNATAAQVLANAVFVTSDGSVTAGTMPNNGAVEVVLSIGNETYDVPLGYHNGEGTVSIVPETKTATPTKTQQNITPTAGKVLSQVTVAPIPAEYITTEDATATADQILEDETAYVGGVKVTGTMPNIGAVSQTLNTTTKSYTIPKGYHSGTGTVSITTEEKTATPTKAAQSITPTSGKVLSKVTVNAIPAAYQDVSGVTATAPNVLDGDIFVNAQGEEVKGTMPNNGAVNKTMDGLTTTSVSIPAGYTSGGTVSLTSDIENALAAI